MAVLVAGISVSFGQPPTIEYFNCTPHTRILGDNFTLGWSIKNATTVFINNGVGAVGPEGSRSLLANSTTKYTIVATNGNDSASASTTINIVLAPPMIVLFEAVPPNVGVGGQTNLIWNITEGTKKVLLNDKLVNPSGSMATTPSGVTKYELIAENVSGRTTKTVTVGCVSPTIALSASKSEILYGDTSTLSWEIKNASRASIAQKNIDTEMTGTMDVSPTKTTTYRVTAFDPCEGNATEEVTVNVFYQIFDFVAYASTAVWNSDKARDIYGKSREDRDGSVSIISGRMNNGNSGLLLWTHPNWADYGVVSGVYDLGALIGYKADRRDHISGTVGLLDGSTGDVTFSIVLMSQGLPDFTIVGPIQLDYNDRPAYFDNYIPPTYDGKNVKFVLKVDAGPSSGSDHAVWNDVLLMRGVPE
jgi:hypothetical protein